MVLLAIATVVVALQIIMRYVVGHPLSWSEQLARFIFIWMMMLAIPIMFYGRTYLCFDLLLGALPKNVHDWIQLLIDVLMFIFCVYNLYNSANLILHTKPTLMTAGVRVPQVFMYSSLCISMFLSSIVMGDHLRLSVRK